MVHQESSFMGGNWRNATSNTRSLLVTHKPRNMPQYSKLWAQSVAIPSIDAFSRIIFTTYPLQKMWPTRCRRAIQVMKYTARHIYECSSAAFGNPSHRMTSTGDRRCPITGYTSARCILVRYQQQNIHTSTLFSRSVSQNLTHVTRALKICQHYP